MRLLHRFDAHPQLFDAYTTTIASLLHLDGLEPTLRCFEKILLLEIGYGITFASVDGEALEPGFDYRYEPERGFVTLGARVAEAGVMQDVFNGDDLAAIADDQYESPRVLASAKRLMRLALRPRLGDRPLNSRRLFS